MTHNVFFFIATVGTNLFIALFGYWLAGSRDAQAAAKSCEATAEQSAKPMLRRCRRGRHRWSVWELLNSREHGTSDWLIREERCCLDCNHVDVKTVVATVTFNRDRR